MKYGYLEFRYNNRRHFNLGEGEKSNVTINIGDNIQSLAVRSFCKRLGVNDEDLVGINRDELANYAGEPVKLLMNGCFYSRCFPLPPNITPLFFGFNTNSVKVIQENEDLFRKHAPIGCRDCATRDLFLGQGIPAYVTGCLTLTLEKRPQPPEEGKVIIAFGSGAGNFPGSLLPHIPGHLLQGATFIYQRESMRVRPLGDAEVEMADQTARRHLATYRNEARLIITPLLHVASPCMAMGIPVVLARKDRDSRFTAIDKLTPVYTPENFQTIDWSPQPMELEAVKEAMANALGRLMKGEPVDEADKAFLTKVYDGQSLPPGDPGSSPRPKQKERREIKAAGTEKSEEGGETTGSKGEEAETKRRGKVGGKPKKKRAKRLRLLVIKPSSLGDIVHGLQVVQTVARKLPECRIAWVARDRFAPLVEAAQFVDEVIVFRRKEGLRGLFDVMRTLRKREFDAVWDIQGLLRSGLMAAAARSPVKWGRNDSRECAGLFTRKVAMPPGHGPHHAIPVLLEFARTLGIEGGVEFPLELRPGPVFPWAGFFEGNPRRRFVIFTDSRGAEKEWKGFGELTRIILEKLPDSRVAWCAGKPAAPDFAVPEGRFLNLTGCPFGEMIELARQPSVFIGNDSGPMHLSAAVGNRVLAIFGPTSPARFGPWPPDSPRTASVVAPGGVLADLSPEKVFEALEKLLAAG